MKPGKKKRRWILWTSLALVVVLVVTIVGINRGRRALQAMQPTYQQVQATTGDLALTVYGSGSLAASDSVNVPAPISGTVAEWYFEVGDEVRKGDVLGIMDADRYEEDIDALKEKVEELQTSLENYQDELDTSIAYSPIDGIVKEVYVQAGSDISRVNQVYGCFMRLASDDTMRITFTPSGGYGQDVGDYVSIYPDGYGKVIGQVVAVNGGTSTAELQSYIPSGTKATIMNINETDEIGSGTLTCSSEVTITGNNEIAAVYVQAGQHVSKGQKLLQYDSDISGSIEDKQEDLAEARADLAELEAASLEIIATADGVLTVVNTTEMNKDITAAQISPLDAMDLVVAIDELDIASIQVDQSASISIDALPDDTYTGTVSRISQVGLSAGGVTTYDVTLTIEETGGLRIGMNASAEILVDKRQDVVILPLEAVQFQGDRPYVLLPEGSGADQAAPGDSPGGMGQFDGEAMEELSDEDRQAMLGSIAAGSLGGSTEGTVLFIEVGLMNEQYAEIISGLEAGDTVLVPVSASASAWGNMGGGMMGGGPVVVTQTNRSASGGRWQGR